MSGAQLHDVAVPLLKLFEMPFGNGGFGVEHSPLENVDRNNEGNAPSEPNMHVAIENLIFRSFIQIRRQTAVHTLSPLCPKRAKGCTAEDGVKPLFCVNAVNRPTDSWRSTNGGAKVAIPTVAA